MVDCQGQLSRPLGSIEPQVQLSTRYDTTHYGRSTQLFLDRKTIVGHGRNNWKATSTKVKYFGISFKVYYLKLIKIVRASTTFEIPDFKK